MKRIILLFGILLSFAAVRAQSATSAAPADAPTPQQKAHTQAMQMQKMLGLSDEQTTSVEALFLTRIQSIDQINNDATKTDQQKKEDIQKVRDQNETDVLAVLTPDQIAKYKQIKADRQNRQQSRAAA
ncbi:MAG TPA: hypothetical protein VFU15_01010, partial [Bacteroidia bacterium]|nr:hypothetical protein [Bacteroidia bacterium]